MAKYIAVLQLVLIAPAALFLAAVIIRYIPGLHGVQSFVMLYATRERLWLLLVTMPLVVFLLGAATLLQVRTRLIAATTGLSAVILTVIFLHMMAN